MTVASCPSCKENVTVPVDATADCVVRCPLCHEEFRLEAFLTQLPPSLIVLDAETGNELHEACLSDSESSSSSSDVLSVYVGSETPADSTPAFDFTPGSVDEEDSETATPEKSRRRRPKNPTVEVIKIIAGALLAFPAAQILLWLLPNDLKRDPFGVGPPISRVIPWIVPEQFRAPTEDAADDLTEETTTTSRRPMKPRARTRGNSGSAVDPSQSTGKMSTPASPPKATRQGSDAGALPADQSGRPSAPEVDPDAKQEVRSPPAKSTAASQDVLVQGVRGATQYDLASLRGAFETAIQASVAWDTELDLSDERRAALNDEFYAAFAQLSAAVTFPPPNEPGIEQLASALSSALGTFATQPEKLAMIGNESSAWLDQPTRPNQGIFLFGTVKKIIASSELYETALELAARKRRTVTVVSRVDPRRTFKVGDHILMLGVIVDEPNHNLLGYEGEEPMVVMGGFPILLK